MSREIFEADIREFKPELVVIDVLRSVFHGDTCKTEDVSPFLAYLDSICERFKTALIIVHYTPKNNDNATASGSTYLDGWPDLIIHIHDKRKVGTATLAELEFRTRSADIDPLTISYDESNSPVFALLDTSAQDFEFENAKRWLGAGWGIKDVAEVLSPCSYHKARRLIKDWERDGKVECANPAKGRGGARKKFQFNAFWVTPK